MNTSLCAEFTRDWRDPPPKYGRGICRTVCVRKWKRRVLGRLRGYIFQKLISILIWTLVLQCSWSIPRRYSTRLGSWPRTLSRGSSINRWPSGRCSLPLCNYIHRWFHTTMLEVSICFYFVVDFLDHKRVTATRWLWLILRPITSYGALDLPTYFLDVTPFVPILVDGQAHNFTIDVLSAESDHTTLQNWFVSGNLQVFTDPSRRPTTGRILRANNQPFAATRAVGNVDRDGSLRFTITASRSIHIESEIVSGSGKESHVTWTQAYDYSSSQQWLNNSLIQVNLYPIPPTKVLWVLKAWAEHAANYFWPLQLHSWRTSGPRGSLLIPIKHQLYKPQRQLHRL